MTLSEIVDVVCAKIDQNDSSSREAAKKFVQCRYETIQNSFEWRDTETLTTVTLNGSTLDLPSDMDRVYSIRIGKSVLDPVDLNILIQTDPEILNRSAPRPTVYREYQENGVKKIGFYPYPIERVSATIAGRKVLSRLSEDGDVPAIRNIDQVLIVFATADMLERAHQYGKAQAKFSEAGALLDAVQTLEKSRANKPRVVKKLSVLGNTLAELTDQVCSVTGQWTLDAVVFIKNALRAAYQDLYDSQLWAESTVMARVPNDGSVIILPDYFGRVISVRANNGSMQFESVTADVLYGVAPGIFDEIGDPVGFSYLTSVGVQFLPPTRERLVFRSNSTTDFCDIFVRGEVAGSEVSETVKLTGTTATVTRNKYDTPLTVSKPLTVGNVTVESELTETLLQILPYNECEKRHMRIWLHPGPGNPDQYLVLGKRTIQPLVTDEDTPLLRDCQSALVAIASASIFLRLKDTESAKVQTSLAQEAVARMVRLETVQGASGLRVLPMGDMTCPYDIRQLTKAG